MATITVQHQVPFDNTREKYCAYAGDFYGYQECRYLKRRNRTFGKKRPAVLAPKCTLFDAWLEENGPYCIKCEECYKLAHAATYRKEAQDELRH